MKNNFTQSAETMLMKCNDKLGGILNFAEKIDEYISILETHNFEKISKCDPYEMFTSGFLTDCSKPKDSFNKKI